jgi:hypothetical protein
MANKFTKKKEGLSNTKFSRMYTYGPKLAQERGPAENFALTCLAACA